MSNKTPVVTFRMKPKYQEIIELVMDQDNCTKTSAIEKLLELGVTVWLQNLYLEADE